jgi:CheY-like chemotaxis protein
MRKQILIADDNLAVRKLLRLLFSEHKFLYICDEAVNGRDAVAKSIRHNPDLVILDFSMPEMDGATAARLISEIRPGTPIILYTLHADALGRQRLPGVTKLVSKDDFQSLRTHAETLMSGAAARGAF